MIKHLFKLLWNQRQQNGWLFAELFVVAGLLWFVLDTLFVEQYTYHQPTGYNIENCWKIQLERLRSDTKGFIAEETERENDYASVEQLRERLMQTGKVEAAAYSFNSTPYSEGSTFYQISPLDADSVNQFQSRVYLVSANFFDLFHLKDLQGNPLTPQLEGKENIVVLTEKTAKALYSTKEAKGKELACSGTKRIAAVTHSVRDNDYKIASHGVFIVHHAAGLKQEFESSGVENVEFNLRMKQPMRVSEMSDWFTSLGEQLTVGNVYVSDFIAVEQMRINENKEKTQAMHTYLLFSVFLLLNLFFGIVGTFWLRTEQRRGETGLRMALGASRFKIATWLNLEGLLLLYLSIPVLALLILNVVHADLIDQVNMPFTWWRLLITGGGSLLILSGMIFIGISIPARRAMKLEPALVLKDE